LARLLWGFGELRFWPGQAWMDEWVAGGCLHDVDGSYSRTRACGG
jgi:hypothetical protein